jgi:glycosyltransferase involved in cell wall biosynthesis
MSKISVIIPLYNAENFVLKAFQNISKQKGLKLPTEIIFVDNNSNDSSYEIACELATKHNNVKVFKESKQGAGAARNKGFDESKGDFIYFYDVDDQLFHDTLCSLSKVLIDNVSYDAVFGKMIKSHKSIKELDKSELSETEKIIERQKPYWGLLWFKDLSKVVGPPAFMYRRDVFIKLGKYQDVLRTGQDTALDINLGMKFNIAMIDKYVYLYYKHAEATTTIVKKKRSRAFMQWPRLIYSHIPYHLSHKNQKEYYEILKKLLYSSIAKMIHETNTYKGRKSLKKKLLNDIRPMKLPMLLNIITQLMVNLNNQYILKVYLYYLMPLFVKKVTLEKQNKN